VRFPGHKSHSDNRARIMPGLVLCLGLSTAAVNLPVRGAEAKPLDTRKFRITESPLTDLLAQKSTQELFQDQPGFIWIRTQNAVHRYDGHRLRTFLFAREGPGVLSQGGGRRITQDQSGRVWVVNRGTGPAYYDTSTKEFVSILAQSNGGESAPHNISALYRGGGGVIWLGHTDGSVKRLDTLSKSIDDSTGFNSRVGVIVGIAEDKERNFWIAGSSGKIATCVRPDFRCSEFSDLSEGRRGTLAVKVTSFVADSADRIWIGTDAAGLFRIGRNRREIAHFVREPSDETSLTGNSIQCIHEDRAGRIWICTDRGIGLLAGENRFLRFDSTNTDLGKYRISSIIQDRTGQYWIGSDSGLFTAQESFIETWDERSGLPCNSISSFGRFRDGAVFVAGHDGLYLVDNRDGVIKGIEDIGPRFRLRDPRIVALDFRPPALWLGYRARGLDVIDIETGVVNSYSTANTSGFIDDTISAILDMGDRGKLVSSFGGGIHWFAPRGGGGDSPELAASGASTNRIFSMYPIDDASVLVGTSGGPEKYSLGARGTTPLPADPRKSAGIDRAQVLAIAADGADNIWLGTENAGLFVWDYEDRSAQRSVFRKATTAPALPSAAIYAMERDDAGFLWMSTGSGLVRLDPATYEILAFDESDGLQDNEFNFGASFKDDGGNLYFGGLRGFNRFSPEDVRVDITPPSLTLTNIEIAGRDIGMDVGYLPVGELALSHEDYYVDLDFAVLDFTNPAGNRYRYKLENFHDDWVDASARNRISFKNLPPGKFTLRVSGANSHGVWSRDGFQLPVSVHAPPWLSWWAFALYEAIVVAIFLAIKRSCDAGRQKEEADACADRMYIVAERALDDLRDRIETDEALVRLVSHHARDTLGIVDELLARQADNIDDRTILEVFNDNRQRLKCLQSIERHIVYVRDRKEINFRHCMEALFAELFPMKARAGLEVVPVNDTPDVRIPAETGVPCTLIANELIVNSIRHAFERSSGIQSVRVRLKEKATLDGYTLDVSDSGCGLPDNVDLEEPTTMGMDIVAHFVRELGATVSVRRAGGTHFTFDIPKPDAR